MAEIITQYMTENPCYKKGRKIAVKGLMLHSIGCSQPNPEVFVKNWNNSKYRISFAQFARRISNRFEF